MMAKTFSKKPEQSLGAPLALFDLDYTILDGDSEAMWSRFLFEKGVVDKAFLMRMTDYYHAYDNGLLDIHEYEAFSNRSPFTLMPNCSSGGRNISSRCVHWCARASCAGLSVFVRWASPCFLSPLPIALSPSQLPNSYIFLT